jgi:CDP-diacylglycerol--glycerol-3-phosphate 3-phosphatidyltransferase
MDDLHPPADTALQGSPPNREGAPTCEPRHRARRLLAPIFNLPNQLTSLRLLLAVVMFCFFDLQCYWVSFVLFVIAASTDWLDGYFARKYGQVTTLGRILDPFADKVIVCGTFIYLVSTPETFAVPGGLRAWMVVVIVGRELLVTALRSFLEERGSDYSAQMSGKLKMVCQCIAAGTGLFYFGYMGPHPADPSHPCWLWLTLVLSTWAATVLTAYSGVVYVWVAVKLLRE